MIYHIYDISHIHISYIRYMMYNITNSLLFNFESDNFYNVKRVVE